MSRTERATLTLGRQLGRGGQGTVHEVLERKINGQWDVAYKEYDPDALSDLDTTALAAMAELIGRLPGWDAAWLAGKAAWPAELVEADGDVTGFLMRSVPRRHLFDLPTPSGPSPTAATLDILLNDDAHTARIGLRAADRDRLLLLADLADTLTRLHTMGVVVGDLSPRNVLFSTAAPPECFLIGCDTMRLDGADVLPRPGKRGWQLPDGAERGTAEGDAHALALLAIRLLARDQVTTDPDRLAAAGPALGELARAALERPPSDRP
ncbi:hypothetical protein ACWEPC_44130, partial [Nonomuraea sp. NPDC004297]